MKTRPTKKMIGSRTSKELKTIIACKTAPELSRLVTKEKFTELMALTTSPRHEEHMVSFAQSLDSSLKLFMFPVNTFMVTAGFISLLVSSAYLVPLTLSILAIGLGLFSFGTYKSHKESKGKRKETKEFFELADLKFQAYNELIRRKRGKIQQLSSAAFLNLPNNIWHKVYTAKQGGNKQLMVFESLGAAITPAITLGIAAIAVGSAFQTIGVITMTAFVLTPLGAALAAGIALTGIIIGIFVGVKHYKACVKTALVEAEEKKMKFLLSEQKKEYSLLEKKHLKLKILHQGNENTQQTLQSAQIENGKILTFPSAHPEHAGLRFLDSGFRHRRTPKTEEELVNSHSGHSPSH
jgi:hypothetical protein